MINTLCNRVFTVLLFTSLSSTAQFTITETFKSSSSSGITLGGSAMLTAGTIDPDGEGWLRLTPAATYQLGYGIVNTSFPSSLGVLVDFEYTAWRPSGDGADGFSVFLFDATALPFSIGGVGGSLGYAQYGDAPSVDPGLTGGYLGIGVDAYGNFSSTVNGKSGGPGSRSNAVAVRGAAPNYPYIIGNQILVSDAGTGDNGGVDYNTFTSTRPTQAQFYRRIQFEIVPSGLNYNLTVRWKTSPAGSFITLLGPTTLTTPPPALMKVGFAASTGLFFNNHEVRNVLITTPGNTRVRKFGPVNTVFNGTPVTVPYEIVVSNGTAGTVTGITFNDQLPSGYTATLSDITINNNGNPANEVNNLAVLPSGVITADINLAAMQEVTITVNGKLNAIPPTSTLINVVSVGPGNITDNDLSNNVAQTSTSVLNILPVTLKSFTVRKSADVVLLEWVTADEQRFSHIEVERSADGASFKMLDRITAHLGNEPEKQYHYNDGALLSGRAYYRLKLVDLDGRATYSDIRQIMLKDNHHWTVYPNPASTKIAVELPADWSQGSTDWSIVDMAGRKITTGVSKAGNLLHIPVIAIPEGRYTLVLQHRESGFRKALPLQVDR